MMPIHQNECELIRDKYCIMDKYSVYWEKKHDIVKIKKNTTKQINAEQ